MKQTVLLATDVQTVGVSLGSLAVVTDAVKQTILLATDAVKQTVLLATDVQTVGVSLGSLAVATDAVKQTVRLPTDAVKQTVLLATDVQTVASDELTMQAQLNTIISNLFLHKSPQHGVNIAVVKTYVEKWNDDLDAPGTKQERLNMLNEGPGKKGFLDVLSACGRDFLKRNPDCLKKTTPSRKTTSARAKQSKRGRSGKERAKDGISSEDNRSVAEELEDAADEDTSTMDRLTGTGSAASGGTSTLERLDSAAGGGSEVRANRSILCDCLSLSDFPSHALSIHPTHFRLTIPSSNMTYAPSSRDSIRARSLMHSLDVAIAAGYLSLNLVVKYTCICIQGSSHVLTRSHLDRQPTRHGCYYPLSISPHHLHRWYRILSDIVLDLIGTHGPTDSRVMCICTIKTRVGLCILRYRAKRGHIRSCECIY